MKQIDIKSVLIGFLGAIVLALSINATSKKTPNAVYEFSDHGEKNIIRMNKITGEIESINVRKENVREYLDVNLETPGYIDIRMH